MNTCTALILLPTINVPLTRGLFATINECDWPKVAPFKWRADTLRTGPGRSGKPYARRGKGKAQKLMHRDIFGNPDFNLDHRNSDTLDNRRTNLRPATKQQNAANWNHVSGLRGVTWNRRIKKWHARIRVSGKLRHLGYFSRAEEALRTRYLAAFSEWGDYVKPLLIPHYGTS